MVLRLLEGAEVRQHLRLISTYSRLKGPKGFLPLAPASIKSSRSQSLRTSGRFAAISVIYYSMKITYMMGPNSVEKGRHGKRISCVHSNEKNIVARNVVAHSVQS